MEKEKVLKKGRKSRFLMMEIMKKGITIIAKKRRNL